jgi:SAM-dependent methyltransferase
MRRITSDELLDDDLGTPQEIARSFDDLWRINRWLGGVSSSLRLLESFFRRTGAHSVRILDVGSGDARLAWRLRAVLLRRGWSTEFCVLDRRFSHLAIGRPSTSCLLPVVAEVFALPFPERSFHVVMCNLFFHHFSGERARELLRGLAAVASEAVLINDLERHLLPYLFIRGAYPFARSRVTRHDAPASVRQAYTRDELRALATSAGFRNFEIERLAPFRLGMTLWKEQN